MNEESDRDTFKMSDCSECDRLLIGRLVQELQSYHLRYCDARGAWSAASLRVDNLLVEAWERALGTHKNIPTLPLPSEAATPPG